LFGPAPTDVVPPRIPRRSSHYRFALLVVAGYSYDEACRLLALNPRTAERWRTRLRQQAGNYFGRTVTYEYAARVALDSGLRHLCETVRGSPQPSLEIPCGSKLSAR
jgi:transposase-like protein